MSSANFNLIINSLILFISKKRIACNLFTDSCSWTMSGIDFIILSQSDYFIEEAVHKLLIITSGQICPAYTTGKKRVSCYHKFVIVRDQANTPLGVTRSVNYSDFTASKFYLITIF